MQKQKQCKVCEPGSKRPAPYPGPRCYTHHLAIKKERRAKAHDVSMSRIYGLESGDYKKLLEAQGGLCYICKRSKGLRKRMPLDHDHETGKPRGILCQICNQFMGWIRDNPDAWLRGFSYLKDPPYNHI